MLKALLAPFIWFSIFDYFDTHKYYVIVIYFQTLIFMLIIRHYQLLLLNRKSDFEQLSVGESAERITH